MKQALSLIFQENILAWLRAKGYVLVLVAALVPAGLTSAWAFTHPLDVAVTDIEWDLEEPAQGDTVNITVTLENKVERATGAFDVLVQVGYFEQDPRDEGLRIVTSDGGTQETVRVDGLDPHEQTQVVVEWQAAGGVFLIQVEADPEEDLQDKETSNNHRFTQIQVTHPEIRPNLPEPEDEDEDANATADAKAALRITELTFTPDNAFEGDDFTVTFRVANDGPDDAANVSLAMQLFRITRNGEVQDVVDDQRVILDLDAGASEERSISVEGAIRGHYAAQGILRPPEGVEGTAPNDEAVVSLTTVEREILYEEPEPRLTAKTFYRELVLDLIHLKFLIPLIAIFYAAGVLSDERRKNTLPYLFTRPVPRWALPVVRFAVSFVVAGIAVTVGVLAVNAILLGQPGAELEFLYWPLGLTLGALFVYGAIFTLLGVVTERPYLWGLLYVLGVEFLIFVGRRALFFNDRPFFQSWAEFLSLNHWFLQVFAAWDPARTTEPWFETANSSAWIAGVGLFVIAIGALVASAVAIQRRDFDV